MKTIKALDGHMYTRVSNWIKLRYNYSPNKRNPLWDYVEDENGYRPYQKQFNPANGLTLMYFRFRGKAYALGQFYCLGSMFISSPPIMYYDEDGKLGVIGTVDMDGNMFHPYYGEWDECCEYVRLWVES